MVSEQVSVYFPIVCDFSYYLYLVRSVDLFYKLFMIDTVNRKATPLCPFVQSGKMHSNFQKYLRADRKGIAYNKLENFDVSSAIEETFAAQRPGGERWLRDAMTSKNAGDIQIAITNAKRIGIDRTNPELVRKAEQMAATL